MIDEEDKPARTMLTSEGGVSRTTHIVEDYLTKKIRLLTFSLVRHKWVLFLKSRWFNGINH